MGNRLYAGLRVVVGALALTLLTASVVSAHANLKSSDPAFDAVLTKAPTQVVIIFSQETSPPKSDGSVVDASGATVSTGFMVDLNDRTKMTIALKPNLPNGKYTVKFHTFTESDAGVVDDTIPFTIQAPVAAATATPGAGPAGASPPAGTGAGTISSSPSSGNTGSTTSRWLLVVFAVCVTGTVIAAAIAFQTRSRGT